MKVSLELEIKSCMKKKGSNQYSNKEKIKLKDITLCKITLKHSSKQKCLQETNFFLNWECPAPVFITGHPYSLNQILSF
jgi:hypothetical protein